MAVRKADGFLPGSVQRNDTSGNPHDRERAEGRRRSWNATDLSLIGVFSALVAAFALAPAIPIGGVGVPITLQTLAVMLTGIVLGPGRGAAAVGLYVAVGLAGLPVFAGFTGGLGVLAGPSAGYLLSFPLTAAAAGWLGGFVLTHAGRMRFFLLFLACMTATVAVNHALGVAGMMINANLDLRTAIAADIIFLPGDAVKNLLAAGLGLSVHKAFPRLIAHNDA